MVDDDDLEMAVLISIITVCIRFNLSVYCCSVSLACSLANLKYNLKHLFSNISDFIYPR